MPPKLKSPCLHCRLPRIIFARGLCRACYMLPDVRPLYPSLAHRVANPVCRHCHGPLTFGPSRKLCWRCYKNPAIKAQYPAQAKYRNKLDDGVKAPSLSPRPTLALPGTARKIAIMAARIARGWQPRHPGDAKPDED